MRDSSPCWHPFAVNGRSPTVSGMALPRVSAYVLAALVVIEIVAVGVMAVAVDQPMTRFVVGSVFSLFPVVLGVIVARRRPTNWVGPLLVLIAPVAMGLAVDDLRRPVPPELRPGAVVELLCRDLTGHVDVAFRAARAPHPRLP